MPRTLCPNCKRPIAAHAIEHHARLCKPEPVEGKMAVEGGTAIDHVDGYLSGKAMATWPGALVIKREGPPEEWILRRPGQDDVGLGGRFFDARMALIALRRAAKVNVDRGGQP